MLDAIQEIENVWIPVSGGCRIAARIWMPANAEQVPVPAILEYIPYRKRDFMRARDEPIHRYFAQHGYASVRVDIRGSGDSDGILTDEYSLQEHQDAVEIIGWIAGQRWCSGDVGMMGISWGGFNALQVAALNPPQLKTVITLCSTDDRYADDAHYMGGCLLNENMQWGSILMLYTALPPDPAIVGERWREMWHERIAALAPFPATWMRHPWRDAFWKHGSICENYDAVRCPVYAVGGWADGYSNAVPRLLANLSCPRKGLVGPWAHVFPHDGVPGPAIGFLQEAVRWWDHWLKGRDTGIMDEPLYRVWMQESVAPQPQHEDWPGRWVAEESWPSPRLQRSRLFLNAGYLSEQAGEATELSVSSPETTGLRSGEWCAFGAEGEMPRDQRPDDGGSLIFDAEPLKERMEILGAPVLTLMLKSDTPIASLAARLCDVAPTGASLRVSYTVLNLTHRDGHETPTALEPGRWYRVRLQLNDIAHAFPPGHQIRVALSTAYWPLFWPAPVTPLLTVRTGESWLELPVRPPRAEDADLPDFGPPEAAAAERHKKLRQMPMRRTLEVDLTSNEMTYTLSGDGGEFGGASLARIEAIDLELGYTLLRRYRIVEGDPASARTEFVQESLMRRGDWSVRVECRTTLSATPDSFWFSGDLHAFEKEKRVAQREWRLAIARKLL